MLTFRPSLLGILLAAAATPLAAVTIGQFNTSYTEDFDTLATTTSSSLPSGWQLAESGTGANDTYAAGSGTSSTGNTYSFGTGSSTDRALGTLRTSSVNPMFGTVITNGTGSTITQLTIQFTGEQWRLGATGRTDRLDFSYSVDGTSITTGTWLDVDALDFTAPNTAGLVGATDGSAVANQVLLNYTLTGLNLTSGASLYLRWSDFDASSSDDGLAIDNFSILAALTDGGGTQNVPDSLPTSVIVFSLGGLLVFRSLKRRSQRATP